MRTYTLYEVTGVALLNGVSWTHLEHAEEDIDRLGDYIDEPESYELYAVTYADEGPDNELPFSDSIVGLELIKSGEVVPTEI